MSSAAAAKRGFGGRKRGPSAKHVPPHTPYFFLDGIGVLGICILVDSGMVTHSFKILFEGQKLV